MRIQRFLLKSFSDTTIKKVIPVEIPKGSSLLSCKPLSDGVYLWYAVPEIDTEMETDRYTILGAKESIPEPSMFITIVDIIGQNEQGEQVIMMFPIFKLGVIIPGENKIIQM